MVRCCLLVRRRNRCILSMLSYDGFFPFCTRSVCVNCNYLCGSREFSAHRHVICVFLDVCAFLAYRKQSGCIVILRARPNPALLLLSAYPIIMFKCENIYMTSAPWTRCWWWLWWWWRRTTSAQQQSQQIASLKWMHVNMAVMRWWWNSCE